MRNDVADADGVLNAGRWSVSTVMRNEASQRRGRQLCHGDLRRTDGLFLFLFISFWKVAKQTDKLTTVEYLDRKGYIGELSY